MAIFSELPKEDIVLFHYPTYTLCGRILSKDVEKFKETLDESLLLYKFCRNGTPFQPYTPEEENKARGKVGSIYNPR